ncbi:hypothetical protein D3C75_351260 [compost metagenome]|jgi:uncharacterized protein YxeA
MSIEEIILRTKLGDRGVVRLMDPEVWSQFIRENWLVIVIALILLFAVVNLVKTMLKWAIVIIIVVGLFIYSGVTMDQIGNAVNKVADGTVSTVKKEAQEVMLKEAQDAKYTSNGDGTFTITTPNIEVKGTTGEDKVEVTFRGVSLGKWSITDTTQTFIEEARKHQ